MHFLDTLTIVCTGLMIGSELAVSLFVNPVVWQLDEPAQAKTLQLLARSLGKFMPLWYALCLILLLVEAYLHRHGSGLGLLTAAIVIWAAVIVCTILFLVPINNRVAAGQPEDHKKWDTLHRWRILFLTIAMACLTAALLPA